MFIAGRGAAEDLGRGLARDQGVAVVEKSLEGINRLGAGFIGDEPGAEADEGVIAGKQRERCGLVEQGEKVGKGMIVVGRDDVEVQAGEEVGEDEMEVRRRTGRNWCVHARSIGAPMHDASAACA